MNGPQAHWLEGRLHLNHGPIDLIVEAFGEAAECRAAYRQAVERFQTILSELVEELSELRRPAKLKPRSFLGPTARRMEAAVAPLSTGFITPMAAVAGSVADEILAAMLSGRKLDRAYVNNGGDSALLLASGQSMTIAIAGTGRGFSDRIVIRAGDGIGGVATSGWRGRSFSLGIADAVTVLGATGAEADAAATIIANAVDLPGHAAVERSPARALAPDSDLGERLVTTGVGPLSAADIAVALERGLAVAETLRRQRLIEAAALFLDGESRVSGFLEGSRFDSLSDHGVTAGSDNFPQKQHPLTVSASPSHLSTCAGERKRSFGADTRPAWVPLPRAGGELVRRTGEGVVSVCDDQGGSARRSSVEVERLRHA